MMVWWFGDLWLGVWRAGAPQLVNSSAFLHLRSLCAWQAEQQGQTEPGFSPHGHGESEVL